MSLPLVSCLCVTRNRVALLRRAVACFLRQTYEPRELLVLHEADDPATRDYLASLDEASVRAVQVVAGAPLPLGALRNLSLREARGSHIAQWDDDDWHAPTRLADQMRAMDRFGRAGCVLLRWTMFDMSTASAFISPRRAWEGSLVAERSVVPSYAETSRAEDTPVIETMMAQDRLALLDHPYLYVYVYHGANAWDRGHWEGLLKGAQPLSAEMSARVASVLAAADGSGQLAGSGR